MRLYRRCTAWLCAVIDRRRRTMRGRGDAKGSPNLLHIRDFEAAFPTDDIGDDGSRIDGANPIRAPRALIFGIGIGIALWVAIVVAASALR